jgi:DNA-binding transcriptional LysR family regulator
MDTRQLAAFCAVVEKKSFSQAAERLGVTQPAVSLQIRALEKRLGVQLVDRSGRRVEPTEAGQRLYRNAQRVLAAEEQLLDELVEGERIGGRLELGASTGPGGSVVPIVLAELARAHPDLSIALTVADTHRIVELVADRALELGVVGFARRHRSVVFEPLFRDEVVLACPPGHRFAGKSVSLEQLREETLILMQEGAGVREAIEDELREAGVRLRDFDVRLELGLQESVRTAVEAGFGVTFISRSAIEAALAAGTLSEARVKGLEPSRDIFLARATGRTLTRAAQAFLDLARERLA